MNRITYTSGTGTGNTLAPITAALSLAILMSACGGGASNPTSPTPTASTPTVPTPTASTPAGPTPTAGTYTLSGVVFEITATGQMPIEGVEVYCDSCGSPDGHTFVYTDPNGRYSLTWAANGVHPLFVTKAGYGYPAGTVLDRVGRIGATVNGDTRFDIQLVRQ